MFAVVTQYVFCLLNLLSSSSFTMHQTVQMPKSSQLVQAVIDLSDFQRVSKAQHLGKYAQVYLYIKNETGESFDSSNINVNILGRKLTLVSSIDGMDLDDTPCYEFHIYRYSDKVAEIAVKMTRYGAYAQGKLYYQDGQWIPDSKFVVTKI